MCRSLRSHGEKHHPAAAVGARTGGGGFKNVLRLQLTAISSELIQFCFLSEKVGPTTNQQRLPANVSQRSRGLFDNQGFFCSSSCRDLDDLGEIVSLQENGQHNSNFACTCTPPPTHSGLWRGGLWRSFLLDESFSLLTRTTVFTFFHHSEQIPAALSALFSLARKKKTTKKTRQVNCLSPPPPPISIWPLLLREGWEHMLGLLGLLLDGRRTGFTARLITASSAFTVQGRRRGGPRAEEGGARGRLRHYRCLSKPPLSEHNSGEKSPQRFFPLSRFSS